MDGGNISLLEYRSLGVVGRLWKLALHSTDHLNLPLFGDLYKRTSWYQDKHDIAPAAATTRTHGSGVPNVSLAPLTALGCITIFPLSLDTNCRIMLQAEQP